jgi:hypothetical protein
MVAKRKVKPWHGVPLKRWIQAFGGSDAHRLGLGVLIMRPSDAWNDFV